jgi:hypothetical protein
MGEWATHTPDGRRLCVRREREIWIASCGEGTEARNKLLDVALIEAIRGGLVVVAHSSQLEYGAWIRAQADRIERDFSTPAAGRKRRAPAKRRRRGRSVQPRRP